VQATAALLASKPEQGRTLSQSADRVHASSQYLARGFRRLAGEPMHRFLLRSRLLRALDAALDDDGELTMIALALGFATPSHFTAAFRRSYGITPSALRRQARGRQVRELRKISTAANGDVR
jgi:AraC-like DNA-binding protein